MLSALTLSGLLKVEKYAPEGTWNSPFRRGHVFINTPSVRCQTRPASASKGHAGRCELSGRATRESSKTPTPHARVYGLSLTLLYYGGHVPEPTLIVRLRDTAVAPLPAFTNPTCFVATGVVVTLKLGLTVDPAGISTDAGTVTPARLVVESGTSSPPGGAGPVK